MPLFTQGNNINEVTFHTGVVVTVNLEKNTEVNNGIFFIPFLI